ncbi:hypothetical protein [Secundilactobacillus folii]|uniref:Uncharacterized protein n=1 Tax=Secundilactobacillus folii TaxID=2678357 RepID=A0A7X2XXT9_9LACO|nr:hypothetical protein [Secundilactobacillus folii]MTV83065.1 hypothetical protein [Secundilactobacillus folii]
MLFGEVTLKELIDSYLDLRHTSKKFLREANQIDVILRLRDFTHDHPIELRNERLQQAEQLLIGNGNATIEIIYQGTDLKAFHAFDISKRRCLPKYFVGWIGNKKVQKDEFMVHLEEKLRRMIQPQVNCVIFPGLFV